MSVGRIVQAKAQDGTLTLAEMRAFVAELDLAGAAETTTIQGAVRFGGGIKTLEAVAQRFGDHHRTFAPEEG